MLILQACGGGGSPTATPPVTPPVPPAGITPSTTLSAETGNNTSAADSFAAQTNGNAAAANVSKLPIRTLLYPGSATKIYAHLVAWFGSSGHMDVGYNSADPNQVHRQVEDMISRGIQGAILDWYGASASGINQAAMELKQEAESHQGFEFAIMEDGGALFNSAVANHCDVTDQLLSDLSYIATQFEGSPAYIRVGGRPVVFMFGVETFFIDWTRVLASAANHPLLLFRGTEGFSGNVANGGFQWIDISSNNPFDPELGAQDQFYSDAVANGGRVAIGSAYKGFNDTLALWGTNRFIHQRCGQTWLSTFKEISKYYSASHQLTALQLVTWNDYEEGTAIETGVDNCVYLNPSISGTTLNWAVAGGSETTIDHYTVFISTDGQNLARLGDVPSGTHSYDLSRLGLTSGTYTLYVKAVGLPSFLNKMSPPIAFHPGDQPPTVSLAVSPGGTLTVSASTGASTDPDGSVTKSTINFGDGAVAAGPTASHTYAVPGTYNITATVFDNSGSSAVAIEPVTIKASAPGVTLYTPGNGSTVNWPTTVLASSSSGAPITMMRILIDGQQVYAIDRDTIDTALKVYRGSHQLLVQATDATGATTSAAADLSAEPADPTPTAVLQLVPMPGIAPNTVLACTAQSVAPNGFFIMRQIQFSDGSVAYTTGALHTFALAGTYSVTGIVTDQFGATASASQMFVASSSTHSAIPVRLKGWPTPRYTLSPLRRP
jgi:phage baseplate assembly protein gpV